MSSAPRPPAAAAAVPTSSTSTTITGPPVLSEPISYAGGGTMMPPQGQPPQRHQAPEPPQQQQPGNQPRGPISPGGGEAFLREVLDILRSPSSPEQQQSVLDILRSNPQLMTAFLRHRRQQQIQHQIQNISRTEGPDIDGPSNSEE